MKIDSYSFGSLVIDGQKYEKDIIIKKGKIKKRKKKASKQFRSNFGHTPLSIWENIPWNCQTLIIGTGNNGALPVMEEVREKARQKGIKLVLMTTPEALKHINDADTNFILHLTC